MVLKTNFKSFLFANNSIRHKPTTKDAKPGSCKSRGGWKQHSIIDNNDEWWMMVISAKTFRLSRKRSRGSTKKDLNLVSILVCVVVVFLFCNIPRVIINCYEFLCSEKIVRWALFKAWHIKMLKQHILQWGFINCLDWLDLVLHQLQPPRPGVQRLRQLPHLLLLR